MQIRITKSVLLLLTMFQATKAFVGPIVRRRAGAALGVRGRFDLQSVLCRVYEYGGADRRL